MLPRGLLSLDASTEKLNYHRVTRRSVVRTRDDRHTALGIVTIKRRRRVINLRVTRVRALTRVRTARGARARARSMHVSACANTRSKRRTCRGAPLDII